MNLSSLSGMDRILQHPGCALRLGEWLEGLSRIAVVSGPGFRDRGGASTDLWRVVELVAAEIVHLTISGEPSDLWVDAARESLRDLEVDAVISIGGGSALDAGKALAVMLCEDGPTLDFLEGVGTRKPSGNMRPWFALPTTAGTGSEASSNAVLSRPGPGGFKKSLRHPSFRAAGVLLDGELTRGAPALVTAACGMDAFTQLLESWMSVRVSSELEPWLEKGLLMAAEALPMLVKHPTQATAVVRQDMLTAAFLSGVGLSRAGLGTVHGLAGPAGACSRVPHGLLCARFFGPCLRETRHWLEEHAQAPVLEKLRRLQRAGIDWDEMETWADTLGLPQLKSYGLGEAEIRFILQSASDRDSPARLGPVVWERVLREVLV